MTRLSAFASLFALLVTGAVVAAPPAQGDGCCGSRTGCAPPAALVGNVQSAETCRLLVVPGPKTAVDRGALAKLETPRTLVGSFRFWEEPAGQVLYVYDDVQNLVGRIVNPERVVVLVEGGVVQ